MEATWLSSRWECVPNNRDDQETQMLKTDHSIRALRHGVREDLPSEIRTWSWLVRSGFSTFLTLDRNKQTKQTINRILLYRERRDSLLHRAPSRENAWCGGQVVLAMKNVRLDSILIGILSTAGWWHFCRQKVQAGAQILALRTLLRENNSWGR